MKKSVSLLLTVLMAMSVITVAATSVSAAETAKVNNENCYVGQKVSYTYFLQAPGKAEDFQGHLEYTDGLKLEKVELADATGSMADGAKGVMVNTEISNNVYYSGVNIKEGYDYTTKASFITAEFTVEKAGEQTVSNKLEILSGSNGTQYVDNYKAIEGVQSSEETVVSAIDAESITLDATAKTIYAGSKFTLTATVTPELASLTNEVKWASSNEAVATVDNGVVTAKKSGSANITATIGTVSATCKVTVKKHVSSVKLNATKKTTYNGTTLKLTATVNPKDASNKKVSWSTSNKSVATVSPKGVVTAKKPGTATITVKTKDSGKKAKCVVTVKAQKAKKVTVNCKKSISLKKKGAKTTIKATVSPTNTYKKTIKVSNSNKKAVKVSATKITSGKKVKVTALKKGSSNIKFTANDGSRKSTTVKVTVKK